MPALIIHGGAGTPRPKAQRKEIAEALLRIARTIWEHVQQGGSAVDCAVQATVLDRVQDLLHLGDPPDVGAAVGARRPPAQVSIWA